MSYFAELKRRIRIHMCKKTKSRKKSLATEGVCDRASRQKSGEGISTHAATVEEVERANGTARARSHVPRSPFCCSERRGKLISIMGSGGYGCGSHSDPSSCDMTCTLQSAYKGVLSYKCFVTET